MMSQSADDEPKKDPTAEAGIKVINNRRARIGEQILYKKIFFKILCSVIFFLSSEHRRTTVLLSQHCCFVYTFALKGGG